MEKLKDEQGVLSMIDAVLFVIILFVVTILIFQQFGGALTRERDLESSEFRREAVHDIQQIALDSVIEETGYMNSSESKSKTVKLVNVTAERAIKDYLYLDHISRSEGNLAYNLSELAMGIKQIYKRCAWDVSQYNFALSSSYKTSKLFLSNSREINSQGELPPERAASTTPIVLEGKIVDVTLYIWR